MEEMRADMGGAATVLATILSVAQLELPLNIVGWYFKLSYSYFLVHNRLVFISRKKLA